LNFVKSAILKLELELSRERREELASIIRQMRHYLGLYDAEEEVISKLRAMKRSTELERSLSIERADLERVQYWEQIDELKNHRRWLQNGPYERDTFVEDPELENAISSLGRISRQIEMKEMDLKDRVLAEGQSYGRRIDYRQARLERVHSILLELNKGYSRLSGQDLSELFR
jgi:hypothetical protein